jgi:signal transduction histidine kinase
MMKTDGTQTDRRVDARLALAQRQRRFEWELAREEHTRAAAKLVAGKTHDMMNLVQIVQLASLELEQRCGEDAKEFLEDLIRASKDAQESLFALMEVARPEQRVERGPAIGATLTRVLEDIRAAVAVDCHLANDPDTASALTREQIEHLVIGLALDAADADRIEIYVRDRSIDGKPWVEIVRGTETAIAGDHFDLRAVEQIAKRGGGELAISERRGGGTELVVALPAL